MEIEGQIIVDAPREVVVEEMQKADVLQQTIPNCESVEKVSDKKYEAEISERISMISLDLEVDVEITKFNPPDSFSVEVSGTAPGSNTNVDATGDFVLTETDSGGTQIDHSWDIEVSGKLASLGFRMLKSTVNKRIDQMADNIEEQFAEQPASS